MNRAADHLGELGARLDVRVVYTDLDGTLLGPGGSLYSRPGGGVSRRAAEAVAAVHDAGVALVPVSGRTVDTARETARVVGARDFIAELGALACYELGAEVVLYTGAYAGAGAPYEAMARRGGAGLLLESFAGRLEPHAPWAFAGRRATMLLRGSVDVAEARAVLVGCGYDWLDLRDNGVLHARYPHLGEEVHAYHLVPAGVEKAPAVAEDLRRRGLPPEAAVNVGDAPSDAAVARVVGASFCVANGAAAVEAAAGGNVPANLYATDGSYGDGFAEVILGLLPPAP